MRVRRFEPRRFVRLAAALVAAGCTIQPRTDRDGRGTQATTPRREVVEVPGSAPLPVLSPAIRAGGFIFLSGQLGSVPGASPLRLVEGGIGPETRQALENVRTVIEAAGGTLADVVKCTVFLADMADYAQMNDVYVSFFPSEPPARSAVAVSALAFDARTEIECIALAPTGG